MPTLVAEKITEGVKAPLEFCRDNGAAPIALVKSIGKGLDERSGEFVRREVFIQNGRPLSDRFTLDQEGFELKRQKSGVSDFYDDKEIERVYYPEMERLLVKATGASKVLIFDHTRRIDDPNALADKKARPPAAIVHNDFTVLSAEQRVRDLLPVAEANIRLEKRFSSINVWRALREPVETAPLAICEYSTIKDEDLITAERHYPNQRIGRIYNLAFNPTQQWYYFAHLMCDEVILLKCYDSLLDGTARWTAHGSFRDPDQPVDATPRESIEIRSMLFFD